jgi:hypothetical protein
MASEFPGTPRLLKGALVVFETSAPIPTNLIVFQYNPDQLTRSFKQQTPPAPDPKKAKNPQQALPPIESFTVSVDLDAADQLEQANPLAIATGLHPTLAALELLLYPPSTEIILGKALALFGSSKVTPAKLPLVLFFWGPLRVVPVRVTTVSITEQAFDQLLNPIRAKVDLGLSTLTQEELKTVGAPFDTLALVQLIAKEVLARTAAFSGVAEISASISF